jgi:hypothetical protein
MCAKEESEEAKNFSSDIEICVKGGTRMCTAIKVRPSHVTRQPMIVLHARGLDMYKPICCDLCNLRIEPACEMTVLKEGREIKVVHLRCANGRVPLTAEQVDCALDRIYGPRTRTLVKAK